MSDQKRLLFVSPQFLFPLDAGGKIRTTNILRHLKGGAFHIDLVSPASHPEIDTYDRELQQICDRFQFWERESTPGVRGVDFLKYFFSSLPMSIARDQSARGRDLVVESLQASPDIIVADFAHGAILCPDEMKVRSVLFTHNVEAEILFRHARTSAFPMSWVWRREAGKMAAYETKVSRQFTRTIAVSERDRDHFERELGSGRAFAIPTGVDLDYFSFAPPRKEGPPVIAFTGSMNWRANIDGIEWFRDEVWPHILAAKPQALFRVIGKDPPQSLVDSVAARGFNWQFTGFVEDIRDHMSDVAAYVIPLRVGGGTRIKAFEAMAMGKPMVSTGLGVEGLPVTEGQHLSIADSAEAFAKATLALLDNRQAGEAMARRARDLVENEFGAEKVARAFENICLGALASGDRAF